MVRASARVGGEVWIGSGLRVRVRVRRIRVRVRVRFLSHPLILASPYNFFSLYRNFHSPKPLPTSYRKSIPGLEHNPPLHNITSYLLLGSL
jgi:hypothetical protein